MLLTLLILCSGLNIKKSLQKIRRNGSSKNPCLLSPHLIFSSSVLHYDRTKPISATIPWGIEKPILLRFCLDLNRHILGDRKEKVFE